MDDVLFTFIITSMCANPVTAPMWTMLLEQVDEDTIKVVLK